MIRFVMIIGIIFLGLISACDLLAQETALLVRVTATDTGEPIGEADVTVFASPPNASMTTYHTNSGGESEVTVSSSGQTMITAKANGYRSTDEIVLPGSRESVLTLRLRPVRIVRGRTVDKSGAPLAGATVILVAEGPRRRVAYDSEDVARTDAIGLFEFRYVPTDATVTFITIPDGGQPHESAGVVIPLSVPGSVATVDLAVPFVPASSLDGSVVSHDGSGTGFAHVHVSARRALVGRLSDSAIHHLSLLGIIERSTTADANGRFWFQGLPSGEVDVRVRSGDGARARHVVSTAPGGEARLDFVVSRVPARLY